MIISPSSKHLWFYSEMREMYKKVMNTGVPYRFTCNNENKKFKTLKFINDRLKIGKF